MTNAPRTTVRMSRICPQCEYDLTGLPEPCVCPECGREIEAGLRSIGVWSTQGKPSWVVMISTAFLGLMMISTSVSQLLTRQFEWPFVIILIMGPYFLYISLRHVRRYWLRLSGGTSALLMCSTRGIGFVEGRKAQWYEWRHVRFIRQGWSPIGQSRVLVIAMEDDAFGVSFMSPVLRVVIPHSRRTLAHVRNTLRRHHRAWRRANASLSEPRP